MTRWLAAPSLALLLGCVNDPVATTPSNNPDVHVDLLFTHEGCSVFRFRDGAYHYYVRCDGAPPQPAAAMTLSCLGKHCRDDDAIPTLPSPPR
jgi:hypothetical protein